VADETAARRSDAGSGLDAVERRLLAEMPLHAITSVHGEAGLRERLLIEIAGFPAPDQDRVRDALALASRLHAGDRRQREPYINHLLRVAIRVLSHYRARDPDVARASGGARCAGYYSAGAPPGVTAPTPIQTGPVCPQAPNGYGITLDAVWPGG
jgi:hypothetical protein